MVKNLLFGAEIAVIWGAKLAPVSGKEFVILGQNGYYFGPESPLLLGKNSCYFGVERLLFGVKNSCDSGDKIAWNRGRKDMNIESF